MTKDQKNKLDGTFYIAVSLFLVVLSQSYRVPDDSHFWMLLFGAGLFGLGIYKLTQKSGNASAVLQYCKKCGEQIDTQDRFCSKCGAGIV